MVKRFIYWPETRATHSHLLTHLTHDPCDPWPTVYSASTAATPEGLILYLLYIGYTNKLVLENGHRYIGM